jgi:hypothetical protein
LLSCAHRLPISIYLNPTHRISLKFSQIGSGEIKRGFWFRYGHGEAATGHPNEVISGEAATSGVQNGGRRP